jgi:hypothetical protein
VSQQVAFRRVNGHIIPIRISEKTKDRSIGAAAIAAGLGVSHQTAKANHDLIYKSAKAFDASRGFTAKAHAIKADAVGKGPLFMHAAEQTTKKTLNHAAKSRQIANQLEKASFRVRHIGTASTAGLFAYGTNKVLKETNLEDSPKTRAAVSAGSAAAATFAVRSQYLRRHGHTLKSAFGLALRRVLRA